MHGIVHGIPGTLNHMIYQRMPVTDRLGYEMHSKLKKFNVGPLGKGDECHRVK